MHLGFKGLDSLRQAQRDNSFSLKRVFQQPASVGSRWKEPEKQIISFAAQDENINFASGGTPPTRRGASWP